MLETIREFLSNPKEWVAYLALAIGGIWVYITTRRRNEASIAKDLAESDDIKLDTRMKREKWWAEKEERLTGRINDLETTVISLTQKVEEGNRLQAENLTMIQDLKAMITVYKTVRNK